MFKKILIALAIIFLAALVYHFLFGWLFPWCPVKLGYKEVQFERAVVFLPEDRPLPEELKEADGIVSETEDFHELKFRKAVKVILVYDQKKLTRHTGQKSGGNCALQTGDVIYLSPERLERAKRSLEDIFRHELSHALLFQNTSLYKTFLIPEWFREGIAIYYGNPRDNFTGEKFSRAAVDEGYFFNVLDHEDEIKKIPIEHRYKFLYSEFRCFMEYIVSRFGTGKVIEYMKRLIRNPRSERQLFIEIFGVELDDVAEDFRREVSAKKWPRL
jgi:hypothetical protein